MLFQNVNYWMIIDLIKKRFRWRIGHEFVLMLLLFGSLILILTSVPSFAASDVDKKMLAVQADVMLPYQEYKQIVQNIYQGKVSNSNIELYLKRNEGTFWFNKVLQLWLPDLARQRNWKLLKKYGEVGTISQTSLATQCRYWQAIYILGNKEMALKKFSSVWSQPFSTPSECDEMEKLWKGGEYDTAAVRMRRIQKLLKASQFSLAQYIAKPLSKSYRDFVKDWIDALKEPAQQLSILVKHYARQNLYENAIEQVMKRFMGEDPHFAIKFWEGFKLKSKIPLRARSVVMRDFAIKFSRIHDALALTYLQKTPSVVQTNLYWYWYARTAIRLQSYALLKDVILAMPKVLREDERWQFWLAEAYTHRKVKKDQVAQDPSNLKLQKQGNAIFAQLAKHRDFYGFVSSVILKEPLTLNDHREVVSKQLSSLMQKAIWFQQVEGLNKIGEIELGLQLWRSQLKTLNRYQALAVAILSKKWAEPVYAIYAYSASGFTNDLKARFPKKYENYIEKYAKLYGVNTYWVLSFMRQESVFQPTIVSSAGAIGLLQLMPATAAHIAELYKIPYQGSASLIQPKVNIQLGIANIQFLLKGFDENPVYVIGSYNAGWGNVKKWIRSTQENLPMLNWIESIPFKETRNYIQHVLTYWQIYANLYAGDQDASVVNKAIKA